MKATKCPNCFNKILVAPKADVYESNCPWCLMPLKLAYDGFKNKLGVPTGNVDFAYTDRHVGVVLATPIIIKENLSVKDDNGIATFVSTFEARVGIAIFGETNFRESEGANPFDSGFHDNYCRGIGNSINEALDALDEDIEKVCKGLH